jgi:DNA-directed RNA polymerase beta' subunit
MSKYPNPLASSLRDVEFSRLSADEIKKISVKRIHVTPTFDTLGGAVPGGLYDPALGAVRALTTWETCDSSLGKTDNYVDVQHAR